MSLAAPLRERRRRDGQRARRRDRFRPATDRESARRRRARHQRGSASGTRRSRATTRERRSRLATGHEQRVEVRRRADRTEILATRQKEQHQNRASDVGRTQNRTASSPERERRVRDLQGRRVGRAVLILRERATNNRTLTNFYFSFLIDVVLKSRTFSFLLQ